MPWRVAPWAIGAIGASAASAAIAGLASGPSALGTAAVGQAPIGWADPAWMVVAVASAWCSSSASRRDSVGRGRFVGPVFFFHAAVDLVFAGASAWVVDARGAAGSPQSLLVLVFWLGPLTGRVAVKKLFRSQMTVAIEAGAVPGSGTDASACRFTFVAACASIVAALYALA